MRLFGGEAQRVEKLRRQIGKVSKALLRIVERQGINGLHFDAADAARLHDTHFPLQLRFIDGWPEPPPSHHDPRIVGRILESASQLSQGWIGGASAHRDRYYRQ